MQVGFATRAIKGTDDKIMFTGSLPFFNTVDQGSSGEWSIMVLRQEGINRFWTKRLDAANANNTVKVTNSYFEIEGFQEAIKLFKSFTNDVTANYNLQGLIIVPSRAAFAKDPHYNYVGASLNDYSFFFNFQLYGSEKEHLLKNNWISEIEIQPAYTAGFLCPNLLKNFQRSRIFKFRDMNTVIYQNTFQKPSSFYIRQLYSITLF